MGLLHRMRTRPPPSHQFLSHLRKLKPARSLVPFLQSKALMYFPHFYPDKFYNGSQIEENCQSLLLNHSAKSIQSLTMEPPQHLSAKPRVFLDFFLPVSPSTQYLSTGWVIPLASFSQPATHYLFSGWEFLSIFQPSPTWCLDHEWVYPGYFTQYLSYQEGAGNLFHRQIKLRNSTNTADSRTRWDLPKFSCTP